MHSLQWSCIMVPGMEVLSPHLHSRACPTDSKPIAYIPLSHSNGSPLKSQGLCHLEWGDIWASCLGSVLALGICIAWELREDTLYSLACRTLKLLSFTEIKHPAVLHLTQYWVFEMVSPREWWESLSQAPFAWNDAFSSLMSLKNGLPQIISQIEMNFPKTI